VGIAYYMKRGRRMSMTENEAILSMKNLDNVLSITESEHESARMAIQALEEIQQYRAIGTVEEFKALKEKSVAKKPLRIPDDDTCVYYGYYCPCCNEPLSNTARMKRCFCGQLLDWSE
jgi:hypothetical protein